MASGLDFHLKLFAAFDGLGEACHDLRNLLEVREADDFDGRVHVAVRQADEAAGNAAACPEDRVGVGAAGGGDGLVLQVDLEPLGPLLDSLDDFRVVAVAVGDGGGFADLDVAVLALVDGGIAVVRW